MTNYIKIFGFICFLLLFPGLAIGADIYIDLDWTGTESGSFAEPYNSVSDLSSLSTNDDYRFKCGSSETLGTFWTIDVSDASSGNRVLFGAYYDNGGSPAHEDDSPTFGALCGNGAAKPELRRASRGTGSVITTNDGGDQYFDLHSLKIASAETGMYLISGNNRVQYCYFYNVHWGIRALTAHQGDDSTIEYNLFDHNDSVDGDEAGDGIALLDVADGNTIRYNHITGFDHHGILIRGSSNVVEYNYIYESSQTESTCLTLSRGSENNIYRYNYCEDAGNGIYLANFGSGNTDGNEVYGNVATCGGTGGPEGSTDGCIKIYLDPTASGNIQNTKFYNNTIYDVDGNINWVGIYLLINTGSSGQITGNAFVNNVIYNTSGYCMGLYDLAGTTASNANTFYNNSCYDYGTNRYYCETNGNWLCDEAATSTTASAFNGQSFASGNIDTDPSLQNPAAYELWPDSEDDPIVGSGCDINNSGSDCYDATYSEDILDPDNTDFADAPPRVSTERQPIRWIIGAYGIYTGGVPVNLAPVVDAGTDQAITLPSSAVLDGTVTDDGLPDPPAAVTTAWTKVSGLGTVTFGNANAVDTTADFSIAGTYVLRLTADDSDLQTSDDVSITVNGDTTPPAKPTGLDIIE